MGKPHRIYIQSFQPFQVMHHDFTCLYMTQRVVMFVSVHTFDIGRYTVHHQTCTLYLDFPKAGWISRKSQRHPIRTIKRKHTLVKGWVLRTPFLHILQVSLEID